MNSEDDTTMNTTADAHLTSPGQNGWPLFIALSLLFHLAVLALWYLVAPERALQSGAPVAPFAVLLDGVAPSPQAPAAAQPRARAKSVPVKKPAAAPKHVAAAAVTAPVTAPQTAPAPTVAPVRHDERVLGTSSRLLDGLPGTQLAMNATAPAPREDDGGESRLLIESLIRARLAEHFVYPRMAQQQGWQGEVLLAFRVGVDGSISHIEIVNSSGHAILDEAALDAIRRIERIEFTGIVLRRMLELRMPVIYHLAQR